MNLEKMARAVWVTSSDVSIVTVLLTDGAATDGIGMLLHALNEVVAAKMLPVFASQMHPGTPLPADPRLLAPLLRTYGIEGGTRRPHGVEPLLGLMREKAHSVSMHESGRRNRFGWTVIGIWARRRAA